MKRIILGFMIFLAAANTLPAQDTLIFYYDKDWNDIPDKEEAEYYRKAFPDQGAWAVRDYFMSGKLQMTGTYKSKNFNSRQGHFVYYFENGQKQSEGEYMNDKHEGRWTYWYENGNKKSEGNCTAGNLEGEWTYWHESGEKKSQGNYIRSNKDGSWTYWHQNGQPESIEIFKTGSISSAKVFYKNGALNYEGDYFNGKRHGTWTFYNVDGRVYFSGNYVLGVKKGEWVRSFPHGQMIVNYGTSGIEEKEYGGMVWKK
jgi:antitoxin component YwqK of YwqJK toxin-antitoxin module